MEMDWWLVNFFLTLSSCSCQLHMWMAGRYRERARKVVSDKGQQPLLSLLSSLFLSTLLLRETLEALESMPSSRGKRCHWLRWYPLSVLAAGPGGDKSRFPSLRGEFTPSAIEEAVGNCYAICCRHAGCFACSNPDDGSQTAQPLHHYSAKPKE